MEAARPADEPAAHSAYTALSFLEAHAEDAAAKEAAHAALADADVNFCLIPEAPFTLEGRGGFLELLEARLEGRRHAVEGLLGASAGARSARCDRSLLSF